MKNVLHQTWKKSMEPFESRLCGKLQIVFPWNFLCKIVKKRNFRLKYSVSLKLLTPIFLNPVSLILRQFPNKTRVFPSFFPFSHQQNLTPKISLAILKNRNLIFTLCSASILSILSLWIIAIYSSSIFFYIFLVRFVTRFKTFLI